MKKIIVVLLSVLIIAVSIKGITYLLDPPIHYALDKKSTSIREDETYNFGEHFKTFSVSGLLKFDYNSGDLNLSYDGNILKINDKLINNVSSVYDYYATYDDSVLVISYVIDDVSYLHIYNYHENQEKVINKYKEMILDRNSPITFDDDGITLSFTGVKNDEFIKNGKSICKDKKMDKVVSKTVLYKYNCDLLSFDEKEMLYDTSLLNYINKNHLCISDKNAK